MWVSHRNELDNTQVFFNKDNNEEKIIAPIYIGNKRYIIKDILSNSGGFGIIYIAIDTRLNNREVLVKANKYKPELMVNILYMHQQVLLNITTNIKLNLHVSLLVEVAQ